MSESSSQLLNQMQSKTAEQEAVLPRPFVGYSDSVNTRSEKINVVTPMQTREVDFAHPFITTNAWIRAIPQPGTQPIMAYRSDRNQPVILRYYQEDGETRVQRYFNKVNAYRPLRPGEVEIASSGFAQSYYADRALTDRRAGVVRDWLNQDELEAGTKAPLHLTQLADHKSSEIKNEVRFGVTKRYDSPSKSKFIKVQGNYGKEHLLNLQSYDKKPLLDLRQGQVTDDTGTELKHTTTSQPLRLQNQYYATDGTSLKVEIDQIGNAELSLPKSANEGLIVKIPGGGFKITVDKDMKIDGRSGLKGLFKNEVLLEASGGARLRMSDGKVAFGQGSNELVDLVYQAFTALSTAHDNSTGAPISTNGKFSELAGKVSQIKGNL